MLLLALAVVVAGCGTLATPSAVELVRLHLDGTGARVAAVEPRPVTMLVSAPRAQPGFASARIAYMQRDRELRYYGRSEWSAEPARMIHSAAIRALEQSGAFAAVVDPGSPANAHLRLDLEVIALVHDLRDEDDGAVRLAVRAQVASLQERRIVATRSFAYREPAEAGPGNAADAADRALARFLEDLAAFAADTRGD